MAVARTFKSRLCCVQTPTYPATETRVLLGERKAEWTGGVSTAQQEGGGRGVG